MDERLPQVYSEPAPARRPVAWVTWFIVSSTIAVFIAQLIALHWWGDDVLGNRLAFSPDAWDDQRYWTLLTYAWAHAVPVGTDRWLHWLFWLHILSNMVPIVCLGPALEDMLGHGRYLGLYLGSAVVAALTWFAAVTHLGGGGDVDDGIVGASGAVFAVIVAVATAAPRVPVMVLLLFVVPLHMSMRALAFVIVGLEVACAVFHWMPEVAHSAHLGGALFGFLYTLAFRHHLRNQGYP